MVKHPKLYSNRIPEIILPFVEDFVSFILWYYAEKNNAKFDGHNGCISFCPPFILSPLRMLNNLVFPFFGLLNLSIFLKYWSTFLTNTGTNYVPVLILKFIPVHTV